jgi:hypothetical protein
MKELPIALEKIRLLSRLCLPPARLACACPARVPPLATARWWAEPAHASDSLGALSDLPNPFVGSCKKQ